MDFLDTPEKRDRRMVHLPMGRFGEAVEQAKAALFRASPRKRFLVKSLLTYSGDLQSRATRVATSR